MKVKENTMHISFWRDHSIDEMVAEHLTPKKELLNPEEVMVCLGKPAEPLYKVEKMANKHKSNLAVKYMSLSNVIINRCFGTKGYATFSSSVLHHVYGDDYKRMLEVLCHLELIETNGIYYYERQARIYTLKNRQIITQQTLNRKIIELDKKLKKRLAVLDKRLPPNIANRYKKSLKKTTLNKEQAIEFVNYKYNGEHKIEKEGKFLSKEEIESLRQWRIGRIKDFSTNDEPKMDNNGRIYHVLANFPKDVLPYTNIKYEMDAANCHPMLFVYELAKYYMIDDETLLFIAKYGVPEKDVFYNLYKATVQQMASELSSSIPMDVIEYIYLTFKGKFWDINLMKYNLSDEKRTLIKQNYFGEVFYSYNNNLCMRDRKDYHNIIGIKKMAKDFKESYPNVWKLLGTIKKEGREIIINKKKTEQISFNQVYKRIVDDALGGNAKITEEKVTEVKNNILPNRLMKFESQIFHEILRKLLPNYDVINIHDAICVIDTDRNESLTPDVVENVMLEVFAKYHLYPKIKYSEPTICSLS